MAFSKRFENLPKFSPDDRNWQGEDLVMPAEYSIEDFQGLDSELRRGNPSVRDFGGFIREDELLRIWSRLAGDGDYIRPDVLYILACNWLESAVDDVTIDLGWHMFENERPLASFDDELEHLT